MIIRVIRVLGFMLMRLFEYGFRRAFLGQGLDAFLEPAYLRWAAYCLRVFDVEMTVEGREHIPADPGRKVVIVSNHQSQLDIPALVHALQRRIGFVAKRELAGFPLLAYWMRQVGCVFIDRSDRAQAHRALEQAAASMGANPLVVFPEGTRSKDGNLLPAKIGGFRLALLAGAQVLPVLIQGSRDAVEGRARGARRPIPVRVRVFPLLDVRGLPEGKESLGRIKEYVEACWRSAAGGPAEAPAPPAPDRP